MKARTLLYCSVSILEYLYSLINQPLDEWFNDSRYKEYVKAYQLIHESSYVILDRDITHYLDPSLPSYNLNFISLLEDRVAKVIPEEFELIHKKDIEFFSAQAPSSSLFFLDMPDDDINEIERRFGVVALNATQLSASKYLYFSHIELFAQSKRKDWEFLQKYSHPFNAMVISDAYILARQNGIKNLKQLLKNILPKQLEIEFDLTLITNRDRDGNPTDLNAVHKQISDFLKFHFTYSINLTIVISHIHDRNFITNYVWCGCGYGFELFNGGTTIRNTHMSIFSIGYKPETITQYKAGEIFHDSVSGIEAINFLKKQFKRALNRSHNNNDILPIVIGNRKNRLLNDNA